MHEFIFDLRKGKGLVITSSNRAEESPVNIDGDIPETPAVNPKSHISVIIGTVLLVIADAATISLSLAIAIAIRLYLLPLAIPTLYPGLPPNLIMSIGWIIPVIIMCLAIETFSGMSSLKWLKWL